MKRLLLLCGVCLLGLAGCKRAHPSASLRVSGEDYFSHLAAADEFALYSLDPKVDRLLEHQREKGDPEGYFHGYRVLGQVADVPVADRKCLLAALQQGVDNAPKGPYPICFFPRHGIRAVFGSSRTDLVICFECGRIGMASPEGEKSYFTHSFPRSVFDEFLKGRGVKIKPPGSDSESGSE